MLERSALLLGVRLVNLWIIAERKRGRRLTWNLNVLQLSGRTIRNRFSDRRHSLIMVVGARVYVQLLAFLSAVA